MRFVYIILFLSLFLVSPVCAKDIVQRGNSATEGRIFALSDGLIQIKSNGIEKSFVRQKNTDYFGDYIAYKTGLFNKSEIRTNCRIVYIDRNYVTYETGKERVQVSRYKVSDLVLNAD